MQFLIKKIFHYKYTDWFNFGLDYLYMIEWLSTHHIPPKSGYFKSNFFCTIIVLVCRVSNIFRQHARVCVYRRKMQGATNIATKIKRKSYPI